MNPFHEYPIMRTLLSLTVAILLSANATLVSAQTWQPARPIPYPVDMPKAFEQALANGTRSHTGAPGPNYWQQWADYTIDARLDVAQKKLAGTVGIVYHNRSPDSLTVLALQLIQNMHAEGAVRNEPAEVTGGVDVTRVEAQGTALQRLTGRQTGAGYRVFGTTLQLRLPNVLLPGETATLEVDFAFAIPQAGSGSRMGWSRDNLFYLAYWYPQMAVYDDVVGWQMDNFLSNAEFYMGYGNYDVSLTVPEGWLTVGTGDLLNPDQTLPSEIQHRLRQADASDAVVHVITEDDFGAGTATRTSDSGYLTWRFHADSVRDVAYSITRESLWDASRTPVGDRDGDGATEYARANAIYRASAPRWQHAWRYVQHSIDFLSRWTGFSYPYPHMTAVEGEDIMGGGMEYPMMTLIGPYTQRSDTGLYSVTAHELAHMWVPMIVGNDERRTAWMDEGTTSFNGSAASNEFYPGRRWDLNNYQGYLQITTGDAEGPIMTWSDFHNNGWAYGTASYSKPATMLWTLRGLLGEERFARAYQTYIDRWAFKHPKPWDMFNTFNDVSGENLDWYWRAWYYETWTHDHAIGDVRIEGNRATIVVQDLGRAPMPSRITLTTTSGEDVTVEIPVETWLSGQTTAEIHVSTSSRVIKVELDAAQVFPDVNRQNNVWERT